MTRWGPVLGVAAMGLAAAAIGGLTGAGGFLLLGFAVGMAHALEADHLAAVGTMLKRGQGAGAMMLTGALWGAGHTLALFAVCTAVLALGLTVSGRAEAWAEMAVGAVIAGLGARVVWRMWRERVHIHVHDHGGARHIHAHSHAGEGAHAASLHAHRHRIPGGVLGVGLLHGVAGSAGLVVLTVAATERVTQALGYVAAFGLGSLAGMALLTAAVSWPLRLVERGGTWAQRAVTLVIGGLAIWIGLGLVLESARAVAG